MLFSMLVVETGLYCDNGQIKYNIDADAEDLLPPLPFLSAASTVLLKPGGLLKSQMPSQNAERHLRRHTVPKKTASTISLHPDIPPL